MDFERWSPLRETFALSSKEADNFLAEGDKLWAKIEECSSIEEIYRLLVGQK